MTVVESNITSVIANLARRMQGSAGEDIEVAVTNSVAYAAAVDRGWTAEYTWSEMPVKQRIAIVLAAKNRKGGPKLEGKKGFNVDRWDGGYRITVPPAAMTLNSIPDTRKFGRGVLSRLPAGFNYQTLQQAALEIALGAQTFLVQNTPVDHGVLAKGWEVKA
jgi:hypothetical protein